MTETDTKIASEEFGSTVLQMQAVAAIADSIDMDPAVLESLYALGYKLYKAASYKEAESVFKALCIYRHKDSRFWMGFAGCLQAQGNFKDAIDAYSVAGKADPRDPAPVFYAAQCCIGLGDKENARGKLQLLLPMLNQANPAHEAFYAKATALISIIENEEPAAPAGTSSSGQSTAFGDAFAKLDQFFTQQVSSTDNALAPKLSEPEAADGFLDKPDKPLIP